MSESAPGDLWRCESCGQALARDTPRCPECGAAHRVMIACTVCGYPKPLDMRRCPECGFDLEEQLFMTRMRRARRARRLTIIGLAILLPVPFAVVLLGRLGRSGGGTELTSDARMLLVIVGVAWSALLLLTIARQWRRWRSIERTGRSYPPT